MLGCESFERPWIVGTAAASQFFRIRGGEESGERFTYNRSASFTPVKNATDTYDIVMDTKYHVKGTVLGRQVEMGCSGVLARQVMVWSSRPTLCVLDSGVQLKMSTVPET